MNHQGKVAAMAGQIPFRPAAPGGPYPNTKTSPRDLISTENTINTRQNVVHDPNHSVQVAGKRLLTQPKRAKGAKNRRLPGGKKSSEKTQKVSNKVTNIVQPTSIPKGPVSRALPVNQPPPASNASAVVGNATVKRPAQIQDAPTRSTGSAVQIRRLPQQQQPQPQPQPTPAVPVKIESSGNQHQVSMVKSVSTSSVGSPPTYSQPQSARQAAFSNPAQHNSPPSPFMSRKPMELSQSARIPDAWATCRQPPTPQTPFSSPRTSEPQPVRESQNVPLQQVTRLPPVYHPHQAQQQQQQSPVGSPPQQQSTSVPSSPRVKITTLPKQTLKKSVSQPISPSHGAISQRAAVNPIDSIPTDFAFDTFKLPEQPVATPGQPVSSSERRALERSTELNASGEIDIYQPYPADPDVSPGFGRRAAVNPASSQPPQSPPKSTFMKDNYTIVPPAAATSSPRARRNAGLDRSAVMGAGVHRVLSDPNVS